MALSPDFVHNVLHVSPYEEKLEAFRNSSRVLFNALHSGLSSSAEDRVSFTGDRGGQATKGDTPPKIFVRRGTDGR